jgi:pimeloyl-ACP methyl ester carboxylesterase
MKKFTPGGYGVGFRDERITDYSRSYENGYRSIQLFVWYPTKERSLKPLQYEQYFMINDPNGELLDSHPSMNMKDSLIQQEINRLNESGEMNIKLSNYKELKTIAQAEAPGLEGNYPLLLFAPGGNTSSHLHSVICEYLASHGYIVASFPSLGNVDSLRWPFNQIGLNIHIDDMALVINHLKHIWNQTNIDKIGLIAWSVGGVSQAIYCMKNSNIDLLISLDSGLGRVYGVEMLKESPYFAYNKFLIPYLHMTGKQPEMYQVERSSEFYDSIASLNKHSLVIESFAHQHFAAQFGIIPALASEPENDIIIDAYVDMCGLALVFSNIYLKNKTSANQEWLEMIKEHSFDNYNQIPIKNKSH